VLAALRSSACGGCSVCGGGIIAWWPH
jgi:hypothetical protein